VIDTSGKTGTVSLFPMFGFAGEESKLSPFFRPSMGTLMTSYEVITFDKPCSYGYQEL